jgi:hypothetical protein
MHTYRSFQRELLNKNANTRNYNQSENLAVKGYSMGKVEIEVKTCICIHMIFLMYLFKYFLHIHIQT